MTSFFFPTFKLLLPDKCIPLYGPIHFHSFINFSDYDNKIIALLSFVFADHNLKLMKPEYYNIYWYYSIISFKLSPYKTSLNEMWSSYSREDVSKTAVPIICHNCPQHAQARAFSYPDGGIKASGIDPALIPSRPILLIPYLYHESL